MGGVFSVVPNDVSRLNWLMLLHAREELLLL